METLSQNVAMPPAVEENLNRITRLAICLLNVPIASVVLLGDGRQWFKAAQGFSMRSAAIRHSFAERLLPGGDMLIVPDITRDGRFARSPLVSALPDIRFYAGVPLYDHDDRCIGVLCAAGREPRQVNVSELQALRDLGALVEHELEISGVERRRLALASELTSIRRQAQADAVTHLLNRDGILASLSRELSGSQRERYGVGLAFVDLDGFKRVNDTYGHEAGDWVLRQVAARMAGALRPYDDAGRYGGDEFLVVASNVTPDVLVTMAERIRQRIGGAPIAYRGSEITITASFGLAWSAPRKPTDMQSLIRAADKALYRAKHEGRNRIAKADMPL